MLIALVCAAALAAPPTTLTIEAADWFGPSRTLKQALADHPGVRFDHSGTVPPGHAVLTRGDDVVWQGQLPYTLTRAVLEDALADDHPRERLAELTRSAASPEATDLNDRAWKLLTRTNTPVAHQEALPLARAAVDQERTPAHLDTLALALWKNGHKDDAIAVQREAVAGTRLDTPLGRALLQSLNTFERDAGLPLTPGPAWSGSLNRALSPDNRRWAGPEPKKLVPLAERFGGTVDRDLDALPTDTLSVIYGRADNHKALARVLEHHRITLDKDGITLGDDRIDLANPFLIAALPHPDDPTRPVVVYTAWDAAVASSLNRVFHGPTQLVVGRSTALRDAPWYAGPPELGPDGRLAGLGGCRGTPSAADLLADLDALEAQLVQGYAGLEDIDHRLHDTGGWTAHRDRVADRIRAHDTWTCTDAFHVLDSLLAPVIDTHFTFEGTAEQPEGPTLEHQTRHVASWHPWFVDGLLIESAEGFHYNGAPLDTVPPAVPGPHDAQPDTLYRFPTLTKEGESAWLIGALHEGPGQPPTPTLQGASVPLHPARSVRNTRGAPAVRLRHQDDVPVVEVTTMNPSRLEGLSDTVEGVADERVAVLDLRGNTGGSDTPAERWMSTLHTGPYVRGPGANLDPGPGPRETRWMAAPARHFDSDEPPKHEGRLYVLTDPRVASAGETFVQLATQLPDAVHVGLNTAGCSEYGNIVQQDPLPHTGFQASFGHTKFVWTTVRPVVEGRGIFPDIWLDVEDPVGFLANLPRERADTAEPMD